MSKAPKNCRQALKAEQAAQSAAAQSAAPPPRPAGPQLTQARSELSGPGKGVGNVGKMRETYIYMEHIWKNVGRIIGNILGNMWKI